MAGSTSFGQLMQLGHVVPDLKAGIQYWLDRAVGPFYEMSHVRLPVQVYRGEPTDVDMGVALSYSGPIQIELIVQHNDAPSLYRDFLAEHPEGGLHHLAFLTESLEEAIAAGDSLGTPMVQQWTDQIGGRYAYLERRSPAEPYIELLEATPTLLGFFEQIEKEARRWDGEDPHRIVG
jgi:4-hydroxyphenylpyruvate dioxygenase-like putative hemolysin